MHVRIAWEIYNHQQKQKGDKKPGDNPGLVPSTSSLTSSSASTASSLSSKTSTTLPLTKSSNTTTPAVSTGPSPGLSNAGPAIPQAGQKRPASGAPPIDFMHKRPATENAAAAAATEQLLRNQLFAPPRPPGPNPLDPLSNPLLPRPPYLPPFGPSPLRKCTIDFLCLSWHRFDGTYQF